MPIKRFGSMLISKGQFADYMRLLKENFAEANLDGVMCRSLVSVDWRGVLYDCDFNQQLGIRLGGRSQHLRDLLSHDLTDEPIAIADHCYGCTAGQGSSCGGALND
jgi:radical SAM/Cys-rich protein